MYRPKEVVVNGGELCEEEKQAYVDYAVKHNNKPIEKLVINLDGDYVNLEYHFADIPFERIRRITGYLVGTLNRFNDAKFAEVNERIKHGIKE